MEKRGFQNLKKKPKKSLVKQIMLGILVGVIIFILMIFYSWIFTLVFFSIFILFVSVFMNVFAKLRLKLQKMNLDDFGRNKDYYRDIIKNYSPMVLGYVDDFKIDDREIVGTLLKLDMVKTIEIKENKEIKKLEKSTYELKPTERFVLEETLDKENLEVLLNITQEEAEFEGLLKKKEYNIKKLIIKIGLILLISIILLVVTFFLHFYLYYYMDIEFYFFEKFLESLLVIEILYPIFRISYLVMYAINIKKNPFVRTEKGKEINLKLEGLKNYIKDFSMLNEKEAKEIKLWDDYLIYSVIFGHNKEITKALRGKPIN